MHAVAATPYVDFPLGAGSVLRARRQQRQEQGRAAVGAPNDYWVPPQLLIGKALFIYWPHSWDRIPYFNSIPCPYFPNFSRMGLVR